MNARRGMRGSQQLAMKFRDAIGLGCMAEARNRLTRIDIDARGAEADRLTADAQCTYGRSRFIVRTGRDGRHLYYRHNGEGRKIRFRRIEAHRHSWWRHGRVAAIAWCGAAI